MSRLVMKDLSENTALGRSEMVKLHGGRYGHSLRYFRRPSVVINDGGTGPYDPIGDNPLPTPGPTCPNPENPVPLPDGGSKPIRMLW